MIFKGDKNVKSLKMGGYESIDRVYQGKDLIFPKARRLKAYEKFEVDVSKFSPFTDGGYLCFDFEVSSSEIDPSNISRHLVNEIRTNAGLALGSNLIINSKDKFTIKTQTDALNNPWVFDGEEKKIIFTLWSGDTDLLIFNERIYKE